MIADPREHYFSTLLGHEFNRDFLRKLFDQGKTPSALLFTGPAGVGKKSAAWAFAKYVMSEGHDASPATASVSSRKLERGIHPDFHEMNPSGAMQIVPIDTVREMQDRISMSPAEGERRVVFFPRAEGMLPASSNALLKSLEEPPDHVLFILVCENSEELLPTILSRCMKVVFYPLAEELIEQWLASEHKADHASVRLVARLSQGRPGEALALMEGSAFDLRDIVCECLTLFFKDGENALFRISRNLDAAKAPLGAILTILISWLRDLLLIHSTGEGKAGGAPPKVRNLINFDMETQLRNHAKKLTRTQTLRFMQALIALQGDQNRVLYKTLVFEHIFLTLSTIRREDRIPLTIE